MNYTYKMKGNFETITVQKILFGKGYRWINSSQYLIYADGDDIYSIYIDTDRKILYTYCRHNYVEIPSLDEFLDLIESDDI